MKLKKGVLFLVILFFIFTIGCSKNQSNFKLNNINSMDSTLRKLNYNYDDNLDKVYVAVISYISKDVFVNQYLVDKNGEIDLKFSKGQNFIISLPEKNLICYKWKTSNSCNKEVITLKDDSCISTTKFFRNEIGMIFDRHNFYFNALREGEKITTFEYSNRRDQSTIFNITFNITVQS